MKAFAHTPAATCLAVMVFAMTVAPADARHSIRHHHRHMAMHAPRVVDAIREPDPYGVYFGGYKVSRDPDPNVRQELLRDYWAIYRW
jgi:hypothetical protein